MKVKVFTCSREKINGLIQELGFDIKEARESEVSTETFFYRRTSDIGKKEEAIISVHYGDIVDRIYHPKLQTKTIHSKADNFVVIVPVNDYDGYCGRMLSARGCDTKVLNYL
jgi:hypothetical protein